MGLLILEEDDVQCFQEGHNLSNEILQDNVPDEAKHVPTKSSLDNMLSVHAQVAQTLHQVILRPQHEAYIQSETS